MYYTVSDSYGFFSSNDSSFAVVFFILMNYCAKLIQWILGTNQCDIGGLGGGGWGLKCTDTQRCIFLLITRRGHIV